MTYANSDTVTTLTLDIKVGLKDDDLYNSWLTLALNYSDNKINSTLKAAMIPTDLSANTQLSSDVDIQEAGNLYAISYMNRRYYTDEDTGSSSSNDDKTDANNFVKEYIDHWYAKDSNDGYSRSQSKCKAFDANRHRRRHTYNPAYREW